MTALVERYTKVAGTLAKERLTIKRFKCQDDMYKFLATGDNALRWRESKHALPPGTYARAGGRWHNLKSLDISLLAHI